MTEGIRTRSFSIEVGKWNQWVRIVWILCEWTPWTLILDSSHAFSSIFWKWCITMEMIKKIKSFIQIIQNYLIQINKCTLLCKSCGIKCLMHTIIANIWLNTKNNKLNTNVKCWFCWKSRNIKQKNKLQKWSIGTRPTSMKDCEVSATIQI